MESYKHSCPFCGQHIEYTAGYCGKQMQCPICGQTITFPALPPGRGSTTLRSSSLDRLKRPKWHLPPALLALLNFKHWNLVAQCAIPFLIVVGLLVGAYYVKQKFSDDPAPVAAPVVQADPDAWKKMTELSKADQAVQDRIHELEAAHANADMADRLKAQAEHMDPSQRKSANQQAEAAHKALDAARKRFDTANDLYHQLGGTVDYRNQLTKY
jgi:hypothetical protein